MTGDAITSYRRLTAYFMSGTGNTFRVTQWLAAGAHDQGLATQVASIEAAEPETEVQDDGTQLLALMMPTHGFTAPWYMVKFAYRLPRRRNTHAVVGATRAGSKIGPLFAPGITGSACLLIALILALKGYSVRGIKGFDMPSNWQQVHTAFRPATVEAIMTRTERLAAVFLARILAGRRHWLTLGAVTDLLWGLSLFPISIVYLLMGRVAFAKMFYASNKCDGCGLCEEFCPVGGVVLKGEQDPSPYWNYHCESCNRCYAFCPKKAVEISYPLFIVLTVLSALPVVPFFGWPEPLAAWVLEPTGLTVWIVATIIFWYALIFLGYWLFYRSVRSGPVNDLFTYTNLAHLYRRHREPKTKLKQIGIRKKREGALRKKRSGRTVAAEDNG